VGDGVSVGLGVGVGEGVGVALGLGVSDGVGDKVAVGDGVLVGNTGAAGVFVENWAETLLPVSRLSRSAVAQIPIRVAATTRDRFRRMD
jgi:hypothetical protein